MSVNIDNDISIQNKTRNKLIIKVTPKVIKNGFQSLRMEEISKYMDVSKATMYKYFSSKEEIIEGIVTSLIDYISELGMEVHDSTESFIAGFQLQFEQTVLLAAYIPDIFLNELHGVYPELHTRLTDAMKLREKQIFEFLREGKNKGMFNNINENLICLQDNILVRAMLDVKFLMVNHMTLNQTLLEYYNLMKYQLFKVEQFQNIDDSDMITKIEYIANKITRDLL